MFQQDHSPCTQSFLGGAMFEENSPGFLTVSRTIRHESKSWQIYWTCNETNLSNSRTIDIVRARVSPLDSNDPESMFTNNQTVCLTVRMTYWMMPNASQITCLWPLQHLSCHQLLTCRRYLASIFFPPSFLRCILSAKHVGHNLAAILSKSPIR